MLELTNRFEDYVRILTNKNIIIKEVKVDLRSIQVFYEEDDGTRNSLFIPIRCTAIQ